MDIANLVIRVTNDGLTAAQRELRRLRDEADGTQSSTSKLGENLKRLAKYGAVSMGALAAAAIKVSGDFEESMNAVRAVSGATGKDFDDLRNLAKKMGSETAFSATEAANGMEYLAMAGMNTQQVLATIPNALSLAAAGSIDLAQSADILSNIMSGMGIAAEESARVADVLAQTAAGANTNISALGEAMKYVAPIAKTMGYSLEEASSAIGILGNAGIAGGQAGTSLRAILSRIAADTGAKETLADLGVTAVDSSGKMRSLTEILTDLQFKTKDLSSADQIEVFKDIAGAEAMGALAVLVDGVANDSLPQLTAKLMEAEGAAQKMAEIRMEGLNGAIKTAKSAAEGFLIALGDAGLLDLAANGVKMLADGISQLSAWLPQAVEQVTAFFQSAEVATAVDMAIEGLTSAWENLVSVIQATADVIAPVIEFFREHDKLSEALAISIGLVGGAFVVYNAAVAIGTAVTGGFVAVLALLTSPITLTIAALVALTAAGVYLYQNWDEIKAKGAAIWQSIKDTISNKVEAAKQALIDKWSAAKTATVNKFNEIKTAITTALRELPSKMLQIGKDIVQGLINGIKSGVSGVTTAIGNMASSAIAKAKSVLDIRSPSRKMKKVGEQTAEGMANGIKKGAKAVKTEAQRMAEQAISATKNSIASLQKEIALFGNDSALASFDYDRNAGSFKGVPDSLLDQNRDLIIQKQTLIDLDKRQIESAKALATAREAIQARFDKMSEYKDSTKTNLQGMLSSIEDEDPLTKLQNQYEERMSVIEKYEQMHTDMIGVQTEARLAVEKSYMDAKRDLMLTQGEAIFGNLAGLSKAFLGEQSAMYRSLFAIEKGYTLAKVLLKNKEAIAEAWASAPFPANLGAVASTVAGTAGLASAVSGIVPGFEQGGYTGNMGASQVAGVVHGQEYVFDAQATKRIGVDNLNAMRSGKAPQGGDMNISVTVDAKGNSSVSGDNDKMGRDMANGIKAVVMDVMRKEKRQGGMLYGA
ncbi:phage tail tape measure protein [Psychrobacter namhaensis]|uniref:Phage tail tape measure protein n=1 Tax=Psychrobacter namhaensis TaxID=292734 RepID=A0ABW8L5Z7_9GAMM